MTYSSPIGIWSESVLAGHAVIALAAGRLHWQWLGQHPHPLVVRNPVASLVVVWDRVEVGQAQMGALMQCAEQTNQVILLGPESRLMASVMSPKAVRQWCWEPDDGIDRLRALLADLVWERNDAPELSTQETRVVQLLAEGLKVAAVARRLAVSPHTVHTYLKRTRRKFADHGRPVGSTLELYQAARDWGLLDDQRFVG
jgi:DNA-binding CsgD family transcriptional regulator